MKQLVLALFLIALFPTLAFSQGNLNKKFSGIKKIRINTASGDCKLVKGSGAEVIVDLQHTFGDSYQPEVSQEGDRLQIRENFSSNSSRGESKWTITIPDGMEVRFSTGSGGLTASNLAVDLDVNTGSGDITLTQVTGEVKGTSGSGAIELENFTGIIKANSGSGDILVSQLKGEISANCGSGDIKINDSKASFNANSGSGRIVSRNLTIEGESRFNSGSGDAQVVLASSPKFDISVNSGSGDAQLDFNGNKIEGEVVMKANKKNGVIKAPFDFDKTEEIEQGGDQVTIKKTAVKGNASVKISVGTGSGVAAIK